MMRMVWRIIGTGIASAVALGCGGDAEQDEHVATESGGTGGGVAGGMGGTGITSSAGASSSGSASGGSAADGAVGTGGTMTGGTSGAGGTDEGTGGNATGGASGSSGLASGSGGLASGAGGAGGSGGGPGGTGGVSGGTGGQGGGGSATGGAGGSAMGGASGGGGVTGGNGGAASSGAGGSGGAAGETGTGGSGGTITACSEPTVYLLREGWWLCGWSGALDHYSWMYFGTDNQMATLAILDATCPVCTSYFNCTGTDGEYSNAAASNWVSIAMPSGCAETDWTIWEMTEVCPPSGYPAGSSAYVTLVSLEDRTTSLRCDQYPLDQCDATLSECPMPQ